MLAKDARDKYRKNRKNNKCNKIQDLEKGEGKKGPEMSANIFAIFVTMSFHIARKIKSPVTFAIFAKFADFSKPYYTISLSKF